MNIHFLFILIINIYIYKLYTDIFNLLDGFPKSNKGDEVVVDVVVIVEVVVV